MSSVRPTQCCKKLIGAVAGEIASHYPGQKQITIVTAGKTLIGGPYMPKLGKSLATQLEQRGVNLIFDVRRSPRRPC